MEKITPEFKDDTDKLIAIGTLITSIFFSFIPSLLVILFLKNYMSEGTHKIAKAVFNFELLIFLVSLVFIIPIIGWILGIFIIPLLIILNTVFMIINLCAIAKGNETMIPVLYPFL